MRPGGSLSTRSPRWGESHPLTPGTPLKSLALLAGALLLTLQDESKATALLWGRAGGSLDCVCGQGWGWAACPGHQPRSLCSPRDYICEKTGCFRGV